MGRDSFLFCKRKICGWTEKAFLKNVEGVRVSLSGTDTRMPDTLVILHKEKHNISLRPILCILYTNLLKLP